MRTLEDFEKELLDYVSDNAPTQAYAEDIERFKLGIESMRYLFCQENKGYVEDGPVIANCAFGELNVSAPIITREEAERRKQREKDCLRVIDDAMSGQDYQKQPDELETLRAENAEMLRMLRREEGEGL